MRHVSHEYLRDWFLRPKFPTLSQSTSNWLVLFDISACIDLQFVQFGTVSLENVLNERTKSPSANLASIKADSMLHIPYPCIQTCIHRVTIYPYVYSLARSIQRTMPSRASNNADIRIFLIRWRYPLRLDVDLQISCLAPWLLYFLTIFRSFSATRNDCSS